MTASFSYATAATSEHESLCSLDDSRIQEGHPQSASNPPTYCIRDAGILRFNRESDDHRVNLTTILSESPPLTEYPVKCEYCGEQARPSLDLPWQLYCETAPPFCCAQREQLYEMLVKLRCLLEGRHDMRTDTPTSLKNKAATESGELLFQGWEMEDHKFLEDLISGIGTQSELRFNEDYSAQLPVINTFAPEPKVLCFRLSCAPGTGCQKVYSHSTSEERLETETEQASAPVCDHNPHQFGICHYKDGAEFIQKYYSSGVKFLTAFPDGSAQVFYPSGLLAVIVVATEENGRVCIVYDDSKAPDQPVRAVFQCDGRATCYHSNGHIWIHLNRSGGQCFDEVGTRIRRWCWSNQSLTRTPLQPVFLSLNKTVGVRILEKERVFLSFLAGGQQAKFSVGACCRPQGESKTAQPASGPSVLKEELFLLVARTRIQLTIQTLHRCLMTPSNPRPLNIAQAPHLRVVAQRLLEVSTHVVMSDTERAFIQKCLSF